MIIGIDTGISGGMALYGAGLLLECEDVPTHIKELSSKTPSGKPKRRRCLSYGALNETIKAWVSMGARHLVIEHLHPIPKNGALASFSQGEALAAFRMLAIVHDLDLREVTPTVWKRHYELLKCDKDDSLELARELFGAHWFKLKKDHNKAEAALIAAYGESIVLQDFD